MGLGAFKREVSSGMSVCAITSEAIIANTIGIATCVRKIEIWLFAPNTIGRNTITVAAVPAIVATPTSLTPVTVARTGFPGSSWRCLKMLSVTTTALSTSMPTASIMPIIVSTLSVSPRKYIAASVMMSEQGTARLTISVVGQSRRKKNSTASAKAAPRSPAFLKSVSEFVMLSAWLPMTTSLTPCRLGTSRAVSRAFSTRATTSTTLACVVLKTSRPMAGLRSTCRPTSVGGVTSATLATSLKRRPGRISRFSTSSTEWNSPSGRTMKRRPRSVISPALTAKLLFCSATLSAGRSTPLAAARSASTSTRTSRRCTPCRSTRATPAIRSSGRFRYFSSMSYSRDRSCVADRRTMTTA